jgi:hypothetical protein
MSAFALVQGALEAALGPPEHASADVSIRQHMSAYVSIRALAAALGPAERSIRQHMSAYVRIRALGYVSSYFCIAARSFLFTHAFTHAFTHISAYAYADICVC